MHLRLLPSIVLLIIGTLAFSSNALAEGMQHPLNVSALPLPLTVSVASSDEAAPMLDVKRILNLPATGSSSGTTALGAAEPDGDTGPADAVFDPDALLLIDRDSKGKAETKKMSEIVVFDPDALPLLAEMTESKPESGSENEPSDPVLFFANFEKMISVDVDSGEEEVFQVETDPILASLEGETEIEAADQTDDTGDLDQAALETADSVQSPQIPDIPVYTNKRIDAFIRMYSRKKRHIFVQAIERSGKYMPMINRIFREYELPPNLAYLAVVESNFNPFARSRANALGMWQFMRYTGRIFELNNSWWHDDRLDPEKSTVAAAKYLKRLHSRFNGDWELALAAYNSGSGTVSRAIRRNKKAGKKTDYWSLRLPRETRGYVPAFYAVVIIFDDLDAYGFKTRPVMLEEAKQQPLQVAGGISLKQIAGVLSADHDLLVEMNPSLKLRGLVPPPFETYEIRIPGEINLTDTHHAALEKLAENRLANWKTHTVKQGETLWSISRYYNIPVKKIVAYNHFKRKNLINIGQKLMLPVASNWKAPQAPSRTRITKKALDKLPGITYVHKVQKGDTLWKISNKYNIPIRIIKYWNRKVLNQRVLRIGTELVLKLPADFDASST